MIVMDSKAQLTVDIIAKVVEVHIPEHREHSYRFIVNINSAPS